MLGIRHYKAVAIDLFVGPSAEFEADRLVSSEELASLGADADKLHLKVEPENDTEIASSIKSVWLFLEKADKLKPRRISFILKNLDDYEKAQKLLFETFPES